MRIPLSVAALLSLLFASACSDSSRLDPPPLGDQTEEQSAFSAALPTHLASVRAIDSDALYAEVTINGDTQTFEQGSPITTTFSVSQGQNLTIALSWYERIDGQEDLLLSTWDYSNTVDRNLTLSVDASDYTSTGSAFDADSDGFSNLVERRGDSDPYDDGSTPEDEPQPEDSRITLTIEIPSQKVSTRAIDLDALYAEVSINGDTQTFEQGSTITTTFTVPTGDMLVLQVDWFEAEQGEAPLLLSSWEYNEQITGDIGITAEAEDFTTEGAAFDADNDTFSNLAERNADSDPRNPDSTPENLPDVRIPWVNPTEAPEIDGLYDSIWDRAIFADVNGEQLYIDNLMINQGAVRPNGDTEFRWFALHDDTYLYVFILGENVDTGTPLRDSSDVWQDDTANLFFDGDNSKGDSYDGADDRHILVPLLRTPEEPVSNNSVFVTGANSAPLPDFEFGTCLCSAGQHTWEFKLPMAGLNIRKNVPFGLDIQLDEDNDGGARDARWGWFHPARQDQDVDNTWTTPSFMGTAVIE